MSDAYKARERDLLQQLAWQTIADPKASTDDKRAARDRLEQCDDDRVYDWDQLSLDEMRVLSVLLNKARGKWPPVMHPLNDPVGALHGFAERAQIVADDARLEFEAAAAARQPSDADAYVRAHPTRCEACGRYKDDGCRTGADPVDIARRERARQAG